jgi:hypothetical protein
MKEKGRSTWLLPILGYTIGGFVFPFFTHQEKTKPPESRVVEYL